MVIEPEVLEYIQGDDVIFEQEPLDRLALEKQIAAFRHDGFWQCMDTKREMERLERLWVEENPPWKLFMESIEMNKNGENCDGEEYITVADLTESYIKGDILFVESDSTCYMYIAQPPTK